MDEIKSKGGRPSIELKEKRSHQVKVTFNEEEYAQMTKQVNKTSLRVAEYIRQVVLKKEIKANYTKEEQEYLVFLEKASGIISFMKKPTYQNLSESKQNDYLDYLKKGINKMRASIL